jgi:hypothetical protein
VKEHPDTKQLQNYGAEFRKRECSVCSEIWYENPPPMKTAEEIPGA